MSNLGHNNPPGEAQFHLTRADAELMVKQCDANLAFALANLQTVSRDTAEKLEEQMEFQKRVRATVRLGLEEGTKALRGVQP